MTGVPLFSPRPPASPRADPARPNPPLPPVEAVRGGRDLAADVLRLAGLQLELLAADWRAASGRAVGGAVLLVAGVAGAVLCVPVLVAAVGLGLAAAGLPTWVGLLIAGTLAAGGAVLAAYFGWRRLATAASAFDRSRAAAAENAAWVKRSLAREPHPLADPLRHDTRSGTPPDAPPLQGRPR